MLGSEGCLSLMVLRVVCVLVLKLMVVYPLSSEGSAPMLGRRGMCAPVSGLRGVCLCWVVACVPVWYMRCVSA